MSEFDISLVSAIYNVGRYLPDFLKSLDNQTIDHDRVQVILVNDGATDNSADVIRQWRTTTDYEVVVLEQANAGQGAARNLGMKKASGKWISFPDPDDILSKNYLEDILLNIGKNPSAVLAVANLQVFHEAQGKILNSRPLRFRFHGGTNLVDIDRFPRFIHLSAASAFFNVKYLKDFEIQFDSRIRPNFEDGHLIQRYLLYQENRHILFIKESDYLYRRRADLSSTLQTSARDPRKYTDLLKFGFIDLLTIAKSFGEIPLWLQYVVLYDLFWMFRHENSMFPETGGFPEKVSIEFLELLKKIRLFIKDESILSFDLIAVARQQREAMLYGTRDMDWHSSHLSVLNFDEERNLLKLKYRFVGSLPSEEYFLRGLQVQPLFPKTRDYKYLGKTLIRERTVWLPASGTVSAKLNSKPMPLYYHWKQPPMTGAYYLRPAGIKKAFIPQPVKKQRKKKSWDVIKDRFISKLADSTYFTRKYQNAWVFMDRLDKANDNAEHLFKYVYKNHLDQNPWFVIQKKTNDWNRLKKEGYRNRLVARGSLKWKLLCLNAKYNISSHADYFVTHPIKLLTGRVPTWDFIFLQHGLTQNDLSRWLNTKNIKLLLTSTKAEYKSIAGSGSSYKLSSKEVVLTGFPRHDRLNRLASAESSNAEKNFVTVMPTWRRGLTESLKNIDEQTDREESFKESEFFKRWSAILVSTSLKEILDQNSLKIRFMPHPGIEKYLRTFDLPDYIEVLSYSDSDIQQVLVESACVVTDYSSVAFDAAYIDRSVVYFHFDIESLFSGNHTTLPGYFDYDQHGFGPVAKTDEELLTQIKLLLSGDHPMEGEYKHRRNKTFTLPKNGNSERAYNKIMELSKQFKTDTLNEATLEIEAQPTRYLH